MAGDDSSSLGSIEEYLAPLAAASPVGKPTGRIRFLEEARRALGIPTSATSEVLRVWGTPRDFQLVVYPIAEPDSPDLVAEFAALRVIKRKGRELVAGDKRTRLRMSEKSNALWVVYGSIAQALDNTLVIESLAIGPAFNGQLSHKGDDIAHGITAQLLRLLSTQRLLATSVEQLQRNGYWLDEATRRGTAPPMSDKQRDLLTRLNQGRPRHAPITDDQLAEISKRYIVLTLRGNNHPLPQLAREFGLTRSQTRDRIHKARKRQYLTGGKQGRAGAGVGPRLKKLGWNPPQPNPNPGNHELSV